LIYSRVASPALRNLSHKLKTKRDQATAHSMVLSAIIFHNLLLDLSDFQAIQADVDDDWERLEDVDTGHARGGRVIDRSERREMLVDEILELDDEDADLDTLELW